MPNLPPLFPAVLVLVIALAASLLAAPLFAAPPREDDESEIVFVRTDDPPMRAAIAEARRTLPQFLALLAKPPPGASEFTFKYPLGGTEHIWVDHVEHRGDRLVGRLADVPLEEGYREGQRVSVPLGTVSDWAYRDATGVVQGHRTTRVLLPRLDPEYAQSVREMMGWPD